MQAYLTGNLDLWDGGRDTLSAWIHKLERSGSPRLEPHESPHQDRTHPIALPR
jgi:hypothetical protein